jgi:hypothetical protein
MCPINSGRYTRDTVVSFGAYISPEAKLDGAAELERLPFPSSESPMFHASCHCGAVRLEISRKPRSLTECNCSICGRLGAQWAYYSAKAVQVLCKPGTLQAYTYKTKTFEYNHCKICGCVTHYRRINTTNNERIAVNARMMAPEDVSSIRVVKRDVRRAKN